MELIALLNAHHRGIAWEQGLEVGCTAERTALQDDRPRLEHLHDSAHDGLEELQVHGVRDALLQMRTRTRV